MIMFKEMNSEKIYTCEWQEGIKEMDSCCALSLLDSRTPRKGCNLFIVQCSTNKYFAESYS